MSKEKGGSGMNGKFWGNIGLSAVVLCLVAFAVNKINASSTGVTGLLLPEVTVSQSAEELMHSVALVQSDVKVAKKGQMVDASFAIENNGGHDIKNISILCTLFDATGLEKGRDKWVVYDTVKAHDKGTFTFSNKMFISNNIVRSDCQIVDMQIAKVPKAKAHAAPAGHGAAADNSGH